MQFPNLLPLPIAPALRPPTIHLIPPQPTPRPHKAPTARPQHPHPLPLTSLALQSVQASPDPRQAHPIAKTMRQHHADRAARPHEHEAGEPAEEGGVRELEQGLRDGDGERDPRLREPDLVQVVHVRDGEEERGQQDGLRRRVVRGGGEQAERDQQGAEQQLLGDGPDDVVAPAGEPAQLGEQRPARDVGAPAAGGEHALVQRAGEERRRQQLDPEDVEREDGPPAEQVRRARQGQVRLLVQDGGRQEQAGGAGQVHAVDAGPDHAGRVAVQRAGGPRGAEGVEGEDVEEGEGGLYNKARLT